MRLFISFLALFVCFYITRKAEAQYVVTCTNCSDTFTQSLDHVTNIEQLSQLYTQVEQSLQQTAKQIELVQQGIEQYENMLKNTAKASKSFCKQAARHS
jgi:P-type conjugative transfer protein TrbJ